MSACCPASSILGYPSLLFLPLLLAFSPLGVVGSWGVLGENIEVSELAAASQKQKGVLGQIKNGEGYKNGDLKQIVP